MNRSVAILGGTFDPVHIGHIRSAIAVRKRLCLSEVRLIPSFDPPHRFKPESSAFHRLAMLRIAIDGVEGVNVDDREIQRQGTSYTVDTLRSLRGELNDIPMSFVLGMDAFNTIDRWHEWHELIDLAHLIVLQRPAENDRTQQMPEQVRRWASARKINDVHQLGCKTSGLVAFLKLEQISISASGIRNTFHCGGVPRGELPDNVVQYINSHGLYQTHDFQAPVKSKDTTSKDSICPMKN